MKSSELRQELWRSQAREEAGVSCSDERVHSGLFHTSSCPLSYVGLQESLLVDFLMRRSSWAEVPAGSWLGWHAKIEWMDLIVCKSCHWPHRQISLNFCLKTLLDCKDQEALIWSYSNLNDRLDKNQRLYDRKTRKVTTKKLENWCNLWKRLQSYDTEHIWQTFKTRETEHHSWAWL